MTAAEPPAVTLPPALAGERREFDSPAGRLSCYVSAGGHGTRPLLLIHSINASASAYEVKPIHERYAGQRPVFALDLPGFGFSDRSERRYSLRLMTDAVLATVAEIERWLGPTAGGIDALAVSLSCEYLARAASEHPTAFHSIALVSPTGFNRMAPRPAPPGSDLGIAWLYRLLAAPRWSQGVYRQLTRPGVIRFFLSKTWGSKQIDEGLFDYDLLTTRQPGARHAPLRFVSGYLFSRDAAQLYASLAMPVWMVHGVRGDFTDYRWRAVIEKRRNWQFQVMQTGALPYFEQPGDFCAGYDRFLLSLEDSR